MNRKICILSLLMALAMFLVACQGGNNGQGPETSQNETKAGASDEIVGEGYRGAQDVEVTVYDEHMDSYEASMSGKWESMFTPIDIEGRPIDMADFDLTPTAEELEAMKNEPAYGEPFIYFLSGFCTSGPSVADELGLFEQAGLEAEGLRGMSQLEAMGTGQIHLAINHIATLLVPCANGVDMTFVGGAHIGCKSLYVLNDSPYETTQDLVGTSISTPNGIGNSDYNIASLFLDADGIDPQTDVNLTPVSEDACVAAMERGEISAAILTDTFTFDMMKDGKLKCIRSLLDEDFAWLNCCVIAMNRSFVEENPVISKKAVQAVQKAHSMMRNDPEKTTDILLDLELNSGDRDMLVMINNSLQFGLSDKITEEGLRHIAERYIDLGLITSTDSVDEVMDLAWTPLL